MQALADQAQELGMDYGPAEPVPSGNLAKVLSELYGEPAPEMQASHGAVGTIPRMAEFKTDDLVRRGYRKIGYILASENGQEYALSDSSVRWLSQPQYWRLMHEQDGSLFALASADSAADARDAALDALAAQFSQPYMEYFGETIQEAIQALKAKG